MPDTSSNRCNATKILQTCALLSLLLMSCSTKPESKSGEVLDEARRANRSAASMPAAPLNADDSDYFHDMDGGIPLNVDEVRGRNTWVVWTGGNDRFWDLISNTSYGALDFLKTLSSYHGAQYKGPQYGRHNRWEYLGLVNEPCFEEATGPDPERWGLWLDKRRTGPDCPADPFEDERNYPGIALGSRGKTLAGKKFPVGSYYGYATGIVGLRLFPNPDFDEAAAQKWGDGKAYYDDPKFYANKKLIKPYRVGMSCAFCHVGPNPVKPPADPDNPKWENISSNVGAQYFWIDRIFDWNADQSNFVFQLFHTSRPGTLDTSLVSTDNINNPRAMNAVYDLGPRLEHAKRWGKETLAGGGLNNRQFNEFVKSGPLTEFYQAPDTVWTPRVLKDGADSVGALGALNRVYLNIGLFSEEWLLHFNALIGGKRTTPIEIAVARKNSAYWEATEQQTVDMALFFLKSTAPHKLKEAPGGEAYLSKNKAELARGKIVFAERCARCHSSKIPEPAEGVDPGGCSGANYLDCWNKYWAWTKTDEFKKKMRDMVLKDDFIEGNFLSTELRVPVTLLQTNACSPLATNAIAGNIWDNFSSQTYKTLPSVGTIKIHQPYTGEERSYVMPGGGRGFTRPASLISLWSTAPFLLNNSVGKFEAKPSVEARMGSFQDSIEKMLWPEKRDKDDLLGDKIPGLIDRTTETSYLRVASGFLPDALQPLQGFWRRWFPWLFGSGYDGIEIGPIPKGTPVGLLANVNLLSEDPDPVKRLEHDTQVVELLVKVKHDLESLPKNATDAQAEQSFKNLVEPLLSFSKCPDLEVNRGHYFGTDKFAEEPGLSDDDKRALIEVLKTF